jgi:MFS family permease
VSERREALAALRSWPFTAYWTAQTLSVAADYAFWVALSIQLTAVRHRPGLLAAVVAVNIGCQIVLMLAGGVAADRFGAARVVVAGDALRAVAVLGFTAAWTTGHDAAPVYLVFAGLLGVGDAMFNPAYGVVIPELVDDDLLASANGVRLGGEVAAAAVGPFAAGVAMAAGAFSSLLWADVATYALAAAVALRVVPRATAAPGPAGPGSEEPFIAQAAAGLRYASGVPFLLRGALILGLVTLVNDGPAIVLLPVHAVDPHGLGFGVGGFGWLSAAKGAGALAGAMWWARRHVPAGRRSRELGGCYLLWGIGFAACATTSAPLALAGMGLVGLGIAGEDVVWYTAVQRSTPRRVLGRTLAFVDLVSLLPQPVSCALAALTIGVVGAGTVIAFAGLTTVAVGAAVLTGVLREPAAGVFTEP